MTLLTHKLKKVLCVASAAEGCLLYSDDELWSGDVLFICTHDARAVGLGEMRSRVCFYIQDLLC